MRQTSESLGLEDTERTWLQEEWTSSILSQTIHRAFEVVCVCVRVSFNEYVHY